MNKEDLNVSKFQPLWDNLIVKPIKLTEKDGFKRPQQEEDKSELGEVISIGSGTENWPIKDYIQVGDIVLFNKFSSTSIDLGEELIVRSEDIVAVYKNE